MGNLSLVGPSNEGVNPKVESQRSINWFPVKPEREGEKVHLRGRPGLLAHCLLPRDRVRGEIEFDDRAFFVAGSHIYEVYESGSYRDWGRIASVEGKVTMAALLQTIVIGDGSGYYALDLTAGTVSTIDDAPRGRFCVFFNQRILYQGENGEVFYSELNDPTNIPGLNFFTAESLPDEIVAITTAEELIYLHGEDSTEPWFDGGDADNPFQRVSGGVVYSGCGFPDTALRLDNASWWVEKDRNGAGIVRRLQGATAIRMSTSAVERWIARQTELSAFSYQEEGHTFLSLNGDNGPGWCFDLKTQEWHERAWLNRNTGEQERQRPELHLFAYGMHLVADHETGQIYRQSLAYHSDNGQEIRRTRVSQHSVTDGKQIIIDELWLDFATGVGLDGSGQGTDPEVMLRISKDGMSWGPERRAKIGKIGQFRNRVRFHRLGLVTDPLLEISVSDPVLSVLMGGDVKARVGVR